MALGAAGRVRLVPLMPEHHRAIYEWLPHENIGARWRFKGPLPAYDDFLNEIWFNVMEQAVVVYGDDPTPQGLVSAYGANLRNQVCSISGVASPAAMRSGLVIGGLALFIDRLFTNWPFRMIYADATSYNLASYRSVLDTIAEVEANLRGSVLWEGEYHDRLTITFERERWLREARPYLQSDVGRSSTSSR